MFRDMLEWRHTFDVDGKAGCRVGGFNYSLGMFSTWPNRGSTVFFGLGRQGKKQYMCPLPVMVEGDSIKRFFAGPSVTSPCILWSPTSTCTTAQH